MTNDDDLFYIHQLGLTHRVCTIARKRIFAMTLAAVVIAIPNLVLAQMAAAATSIDELCVAPGKVAAAREFDKMLEVQKPTEEGTDKLARESGLQVKPKSVPYEICPAWIRASFKAPGVADKLIMLREGIGHQKKVAEKSFWRSYRWLQWYQWIVVSLGVAATVFSALVAQTKSVDAELQVRQANRVRRLALLTVVATTLVTASATMEAFYGLRGGTERYSRVWGAMGALQSRVDDRLVLGDSTDPSMDPTEFFIAMSKERDNILQQASEQWTASLKNAGSN